jgi:prepilin-type N-terminal cleavage/methylation domain-containing protein
VKGRQGFTLMELLVVLLIIGILSTVALRTIDATRDRSLFDQTTKEMDQLVKAIVGNPDLTYDGRRVDFGYYGDMEELPNELRDLVHNPGSTAWHGPYLRLTVGGDTVSYLYDGWGTKYIYDRVAGTIWSGGNSKFPMTVKIVDSLTQLTDNMISGTITDRDGNAPDSSIASRCTLMLHYNNEVLNPTPRAKAVAPGGFYEYSPAGADLVPIGTHKLVAHVLGESLVRWVTVLPRSRTVVDFKFGKSFWNKLKVVGAPRISEPDSNGFLITILNDQANDVTINSLWFSNTPAAAFMRDFYIGTDHAGYPILDGQPGTGPGDTVSFIAPMTIASSGTVEMYFGAFYGQEVINPPAGTPFKVHGQTFKFRFSDGSEITVNP